MSTEWAGGYRPFGGGSEPPPPGPGNGNGKQGCLAELFFVLIILVCIGAVGLFAWWVLHGVFSGLSGS